MFYRTLGNASLNFESWYANYDRETFNKVKTLMLHAIIKFLNNTYSASYIYLLILNFSISTFVIIYENYKSMTSK